MKVGELARRTGISVRTLHYYDEIGLLSPSLHTESGHRVYGMREVARLQQIRSLQQLGFRLEEIRNLIQAPSFPPQQVIKAQLARVREQLAVQERLCRQLESLADAMRADRVSIDQLIQTIEVMNMFDKYYTKEQLEQLQQRREQLGEEGMRKAQQDWADLMSEVQAQMAKDADPQSEPVLALGRRWRALIDAFTGSNPEIEKSLRTMYQNEPVYQKIPGAPQPELIQYIGKAMQ